MAFEAFVEGFLRRNRATLPTDRIVCELGAAEVLADSNALTIVGGVIKLRKRLNWFVPRS